MSLQLGQQPKTHPGYSSLFSHQSEERAVKSYSSHKNLFPPYLSSDREMPHSKPSLDMPAVGQCYLSRRCSKQLSYKVPST